VAIGEQDVFILRGFSNGDHHLALDRNQVEQVVALGEFAPV
jgi:hypothetical protein